MYWLAMTVSLPLGVERRGGRKKEKIIFEEKKEQSVSAAMIEQKTELEKLLHEKFIRGCQSNPNYFIEYAGSYNEKEWLGQATLHIEWNEALSKYQYVLMICPREHGKTTQIVLRIIWELGKNPNLRVKLVCQSDDIAIKRLMAIIDHIENNPRVREVFPDLKPADRGAWTKSQIYILRQVVGYTDPSMEACGILSTAVGGRADLLIFDDPVDFRNAIQQPALRETVSEAYDNVWMNVVEENGRVWYIATLWHKRDLTHRLLENKTYFKITDSINDELDPIWEKKWNRERLQWKLENIGKRAFDRGFKNKALSDEDALFSEDLLVGCYDDTFEFGKLPEDFPSKEVRYYGGADIGAGKSKLKGAYSGIFTIAVHNGVKVPMSIARGRYKSPQFARLILSEIEHFKHDLVNVENNAQQEALIQWIDEIASSDALPPIRGFFTGSQKFDEDVGLPSMTVEMERKGWRIPDPRKHKQPCKCGLCVWVKELVEYPIGKYKDTVMMSWFAREAARELGSKTPKITILTMTDKPRDFIEAAEQDGDEGGDPF